MLHRRALDRFQNLLVRRNQPDVRVLRLPHIAPTQLPLSPLPPPPPPPHRRLRPLIIIRHIKLPPFLFFLINLNPPFFPFTGDHRVPIPPPLPPPRFPPRRPPPPPHNL